MGKHWSRVVSDKKMHWKHLVLFRKNYIVMYCVFVYFPLVFRNHCLKKCKTWSFRNTAIENRMQPIKKSIQKTLSKLFFHFAVLIFSPFCSRNVKFMHHLSEFMDFYNWHYLLNFFFLSVCFDLNVPKR